MWVMLKSARETAAVGFWEVEDGKQKWELAASCLGWATGLSIPGWCCAWSCECTARGGGEMQWLSPSLQLLSINIRWKLRFFLLSLSLSHLVLKLWSQSTLFSPVFSPVVPGRFVTCWPNVYLVFVIKEKKSLKAMKHCCSLHFMLIILMLLWYFWAISPLCCHPFWRESFWLAF